MSPTYDLGGIPPGTGWAPVESVPTDPGVCFVVRRDNRLVCVRDHEADSHVDWPYIDPDTLDRLMEFLELAGSN